MGRQALDGGQVTVLVVWVGISAGHGVDTRTRTRARVNGYYGTPENGEYGTPGPGRDRGGTCVQQHKQGRGRAV